MGDESQSKPAWFRGVRPGRRVLVDWRGAVAFGALMLVAIAGGLVESALRPDHTVLAVVLMVPLALVAFWLAALIVMRTE